MEFLLNLYKVLWGRVARNIYLWIVMLYIVLHNNPQTYSYPAPVYYKCIAVTTIILMLLSYTNNLWLLPKYWATKKYVKYFGFTFLSVSFWATIFILSVKVMMSYYPKLLIYHISTLSTVVSADWSVKAIITEVSILYFGFGLWTMIMTMAWYMNDYARQQKRLEEAEKKQIETELYFLKNQINPHFLFNTLNNLYGLSLQKADNTPDAILRLSEILRYILYQSDNNNAEISKERDIMLAYIALEKLRITDHSRINFEVDIDDENCPVAPLIWLPILENFFKHGTRAINGDVAGNFSLVLRNKVLAISSNNVVYSVAASQKDGGIGLDNLKKRLNLLYPNKFTIDEKRLSENYSITLIVDLA